MEYSLNLSADFVELQYQRWKSDPESVTRDWQAFFEGFELASDRDGAAAAGFCDRNELLRQCAVHDLIHRYRDLGHLLACLDPLSACHAGFALLEPSDFGLTDQDLDRAFSAPPTIFAEQRPLREIIAALRETYGGSIGVEYMHIQDPGERIWLQERMEPTRNRPVLTADAKRLILKKLLEAGLFEQFLHARYVGQKRFSVEGAEVVVPMLDALFRLAAAGGCREVVLGMAHRGRLNVQVNVLDKPYELIFCEFEDHYDPDSLVGAGDVKYHRGYVGELALSAQESLRVFLANNPSHLEAVDPVVEGIARARQEQMGDQGRKLVLPVLIHGDAAFSGQGIVAETLNLSQLEGYHTGGTIHIIINNQIGFTTLPDHARSTRYATDMAKMLMVPIFHVHGEDPEAVLHVIGLAYDYRTRYAKDVVVDVVCYRKYGHNEGDEPYYTQPEMYRRIQGRPPVSEIYANRLQNEGLIDESEPNRLKEGINACLERSYNAAHDRTCTMPEERFFGEQSPGGQYSEESVETGVSEDELKSLARRLNRFPDGFSVHPRLARILNRRLESVENGQGIDWASAESMAFAALLAEGSPVRLSGQDSSRGTFSQRHCVLSDVNTGQHYAPLNFLTPDQAPFHVYDSCLSENGVLGFEYGYSLASPKILVLWEAQFGDFANNAQTMIDQFIATAESKWRRQSGIVLLLPHGLEGQGPEHSSARLERYLQLCAEENIQVCNPSTPAQYFHLLRRQMKRGFRKPLIVMTPKSLLRHPQAVSSLTDLASGSFQDVLPDPGGFEDARKVLLCSGKLYYDLLERRNATASQSTALVRIEQLYPFPDKQLRLALKRYGKAEKYFWVQEEPENMGAWSYIRLRLVALMRKNFGYIGRPASASPATGYLSTHKEEQAALLERAFPSGA